MSSIRSQAEALSQAQLDADNAHDLEPFLACLAEQVQVFTFPASLQFYRKATMRKHYAQRFSNETLHAQWCHRLIHEQAVIDQGRVSLRLADGPGIMEATAINEVQDGLIARGDFRDGCTAPAGRVMPEC